MSGHDLAYAEPSSRSFVVSLNVRLPKPMRDAKQVRIKKMTS